MDRNGDIKKATENVEFYFMGHLPDYKVLEVRKKSNHPDDGYLYMVSAQKNDGTFAVWTSWNEAIQSLNCGHYNLQTLDDCEEIFREFRN